MKKLILAAVAAFALPLAACQKAETETEAAVVETVPADEAAAATEEAVERPDRNDLR